MTKHDKFLEKILIGNSDANIYFEDLCNLLKKIGFEERIRGSHNIFRKDGVLEKINLQQDENKANPYQVKQVRNIIVEYKLGEILMYKYEVIIFWSNEDKLFYVVHKPSAGLLM